MFRIHAGVYAVGHLAPVALGRETAALLAIRDAAVLSHDSAAMLWGRTPPGSGNGLVHVLVNGPAPAAARWAFACTAPAASIPLPKPESTYGCTATRSTSSGGRGSDQPFATGTSLPPCGRAKMNEAVFGSPPAIE